MLNSICMAGLVLLVGMSNMKHFIVETKEGEVGSDYADILEDWCVLSVNCSTTGTHRCNGKVGSSLCIVPMERCGCQRKKEECTCWGGACMKRAQGCDGEPGEYCKVIGDLEGCSYEGL